MKRPMDDLLGDVRFAARLLVKERAFTIVVILTLAISIGGANTVFTVVNGMTLRGLPVPNPHRVVSVGSIDAAGRELGASFLDFEDWRVAKTVALAAYSGSAMNVTETGKAPDR